MIILVTMSLVSLSLKNRCLKGWMLSILLSATCLRHVPPLQAVDVTARDPKALVEKMVEAVGPMEKFQELRDVEYTYRYGDTAPGQQEISLERYVFEGELSWARYEKRAHVLPGISGEVIQGYNGQEAWVTVDGKPLEDSEAVRMARFSRKTNFYWFTMMQKLLDPQVLYSTAGQRSVKGIMYELVKITFEKNVGDVNDTYLLYIHPETRLVDQFLFTVMDFGVKEPFLMEVEYEEINGVKLPAKRRYIRSNWQGEILGESWMDETMTDIRFNNGFSANLFQKPSP